MTVRSMTGFGAGQRTMGALEIVVELKSVNGRFLKSSVKAPPSLSTREVEIEAMLKDRLRRGSLSVTIRLQRTDPEGMVTINEDLVKAYQASFKKLGLAEDRIPTLPGVIVATQEQVNDDEWQQITEVMAEALDALVEMRAREGSALDTAVRELCDDIERRAAQVRERGPDVVVEYQRKLAERLETLLADSGTAVDPQSLAREVAYFADKCDITEEVDRLAAHLGHARELLGNGGEIGRKLDFISQEMLREVNTIGSKSSDPQLSTVVVELKSAVERVKEQVANIE